MVDKYINFDMDDSRASVIAEVMANKTCKKILSLIAEKEMSAGDISLELKIPLNTIGYNIEKLLKSGLIEKSKNYFWSAKGKKIPTYSISNKKIIISPKTLYKGILPALLVSGLAALGIGIYSSRVGSNFLNSASEAYAPTVKLADSVTSSGAQMINASAQSGILQNAWVWFLLGSMVSLFVFLIWNIFKMKGGKIQ